MSVDVSPATAEPARADVDRMAGRVLLEFGASWCPHCAAAQPAIAAWLASQAPPATHLKVEDGRGQPLGRSFAVKLWPTLVLVEHGLELARVVRPRSLADLAPLEAARVR